MKDNKKMKNVKVRDETHHRLAVLKARKRYGNFDELINNLIDKCGEKIQ